MISTSWNQTSASEYLGSEILIDTVQNVDSLTEKDIGNSRRSERNTFITFASFLNVASTATVFLKR